MRPHPGAAHAARDKDLDPYWQPAGLHMSEFEENQQTLNGGGAAAVAKPPELPKGASYAYFQYDLYSGKDGTIFELDVGYTIEKDLEKEKVEEEERENGDMQKYHQRM